MFKVNCMASWEGKEVSKVTLNKEKERKKNERVIRKMQEFHRSIEYENRLTKSGTLRLIELC